MAKARYYYTTELALAMHAKLYPLPSHCARSDTAVRVQTPHRGSGWVVKRGRLGYKPPRAVLFISINQNAVYMLAYADDIHYNIFVLFCAGYFSCLPICLSLSSTVCYPLYV